MTGSIGLPIAFTFPGQGSQQIGMGRDLAEAFPEAARVFEEVDDALGQKLSALMWEGEQDELTLTANAQPALMAVSLAALRALESEGVDVERDVAFVAGHSLGEYSALAAAGTFTVEEAARLLRVRGDAMQVAVPVGEGAMAAIIGLEEAKVEAICASASHDGMACQIANDNGGGQLVVSGAKPAVEEAMAAAKEAGAKRALPLPVSAPFHSAMMGPAAERMRGALAEASLANPNVPLVANVTAAPVSDASEIERLLVEQVTGRVRWRESVERLAGEGVDLAVEVGAGKVLSGLARRIARDMDTATCGTPDEVRALAERIAGGKA